MGISTEFHNKIYINKAKTDVKSEKTYQSKMRISNKYKNKFF